MGTDMPDYHATCTNRQAAGVGATSANIFARRVLRLTDQKQTFVHTIRMTSIDRLNVFRLNGCERHPSAV